MVDFKALSAPFDPQEVSWRVGSMKKDKTAGMALAYIDARVVMERLDAICGPDGWQCRYSHANGKTVCDIAVKCGAEWIWKANGAGDSDIEAEKGALSDAFKRAAVLWGIGRYLYDLPSPWVEVDEWKRIKTAEFKKLDQILRQHTQSILNPPKGMLKAATQSLSDTKNDMAQMANENAARHAIVKLVEVSRAAMAMCTDRLMLKEWWNDNKEELREKLPEGDFAAFIAEVQAKRDDMPALEAAA